MALQLSSTNNQLQTGEKVAIFGGAGSGKTRLCATAPGPLLLNAERGLKSIRDFDLPAIGIDTYAQAWEAIKWLGAGGADIAPFLTVCVDSISQIAENHLTFIRPAHKNLLQAYGQLADDIINLIAGFMKLPQNVILLAKVGTHTNMVTETTKFVPNFPGKALGELFPHVMDAIWYIGLEQSGVAPSPGIEAPFHRVLHTAASPQFDCKDRSQVLEPVYAVPDMPLGTNSLFLTNLFATMQTSNPNAAIAAQ